MTNERNILSEYHNGKHKPQYHYILSTKIEFQETEKCKQFSHWKGTYAWNILVGEKLRQKLLKQVDLTRTFQCQNIKMGLFRKIVEDE
jgi:hypothetical protein